MLLEAYEALDESKRLFDEAERQKADAAREEAERKEAAEQKKAAQREEASQKLNDIGANVRGGVGNVAGMATKGIGGLIGKLAKKGKE